MGERRLYRLLFGEEGPLRRSLGGLLGRGAARMGWACRCGRRRGHCRLRECLFSSLELGERDAVRGGAARDVLPALDGLGLDRSLGRGAGEIGGIEPEGEWVLAVRGQPYQGRVLEALAQCRRLEPWGGSLLQWRGTTLHQRLVEWLLLGGVELVGDREAESFGLGSSLLESGVSVHRV